MQVHVHVVWMFEFRDGMCYNDHWCMARLFDYQRTITIWTTQNKMVVIGKSHYNLMKFKSHLFISYIIAGLRIDIKLSLKFWYKQSCISL